jgi:hypothetical protein
MKTLDFVGYAALPKELRGKRNMVQGGSKSRQEGRFRSNKSARVSSLGFGVWTFSVEWGLIMRDLGTTAAGFANPSVTSVGHSAGVS